mgnify:CR=1 FL=1
MAYRRWVRPVWQILFFIRVLSVLHSVSTFADGIAVKEPGTNTFDLVNQYVDGVVTVTEDEIAAAILALIERQRIVAEGRSCVVAAAMFNKYR